MKIAKLSGRLPAPRFFSSSALLAALVIAGVASAQSAPPGAQVSAPPPPPPPPPPPAVAAQPGAPAAPPGVAAGPGPMAPPGVAAPGTVPQGPPPPPPGAPPPPVYGNPGGQYPGGPSYGPPPLLPPLGQREHDGFYLRLGIGGGRLGGSVGSNSSHELDGAFDGSFGQGSLSLELNIGGTPAPGLVIGGGIWSDSALGSLRSSDIQVNGRGAAPIVFANASIALLGPFVDYYFDPKAGWHLEGAIGIASMTLGRGTRGSSNATGSKTMGGLGFMLGGGYEWWVADQWSLGALLRFLYVSTESNHDDAEVWSGRGYAFPEIMFGATYH